MSQSTPNWRASLVQDPHTVISVTVPDVRGQKQVSGSPRFEFAGGSGTGDVPASLQDPPVYGRCNAGTHDESDRDALAREHDYPDNCAQSHDGRNHACDLNVRGLLVQPSHSREGREIRGGAESGRRQSGQSVHSATFQNRKPRCAHPATMVSRAPFSGSIGWRSVYLQYPSPLLPL